MYKKILTAIGITILFLGTCINSSVAINNIKKSSNPISSGNTLYVGGTGEGNYSSIQDAIDDASDGDTVFVFSWKYYENVVVDKPINLIGEDKDITIIDGNRIGNVIEVSADWVNISGFTIQSSGEWFCGIAIHSNNSTIASNIILYNGGGITLNEFTGHNTIKDNNISNNRYCGVWTDGSCYNMIYHNNFINNNDFTYDESNNTWDDGKYGNY